MRGRVRAGHGSPGPFVVFRAKLDSARRQWACFVKISAACENNTRNVNYMCDEGAFRGIAANIFSHFLILDKKWSPLPDRSELHKSFKTTAKYSG
jgi:hypothetical protein